MKRMQNDVWSVVHFVQVDDLLHCMLHSAANQSILACRILPINGAHLYTVRFEYILSR